MSQSDKRVLLAEGLAAGDDDGALHNRLVAAGISRAAAGADDLVCVTGSVFLAGELCCVLSRERL